MAIHYNSRANGQSGRSEFQTVLQVGKPIGLIVAALGAPETVRTEPTRAARSKSGAKRCQGSATVDRIEVVRVTRFLLPEGTKHCRESIFSPFSDSRRENPSAAPFP